MPAFLALAVLAPELTQVAFGAKWTDAGPVMRVLALVGIPHAVTYFNKAVVNAAGRPSLSLRVAVLTGIVNVIGFAIVVQWGIVAVATSYVVCGYLLAPVSVWSVSRVLDIDVKTYLRLFVGPTAGGAVMVVSVVAAQEALPDGVTGLPLLAILLLVAVTVYFLMLCLTSRRLVMSILSSGRRLLVTG
jgi:PST family polysaccharide transporter